MHPRLEGQRQRGIARSFRINVACAGAARTAAAGGGGLPALTKGRRAGWLYEVVLGWLETFLA
jgi:hypothetical protein